MPPRQFPLPNQPAARVLTVFGLGTLPFCLSGAFGQVDLYPVGDEPRGIVATDLNHDAWPDLVTANLGDWPNDPSIYAAG